MRIALDAMGGDYAPRNTVAGAVMASEGVSARSRKLFLTGDQSAVKRELQSSATSDGAHRNNSHDSGRRDERTSGGRDSPKKDSSVSRAIDLVKRGDADAIVSAGHTGAMVAGTTIKLRTLEGVERPGIASYLPTEHKLCVLIDAGRECRRPSGAHVAYAIMGTVHLEVCPGV